MVTSSIERVVAIAIAITILWSPKLSTQPPVKWSIGSIIRPSSVGVTLPPILFRASAVAISLSLSLIFNLSAPTILDVSSPKQPKTAKIGTKSGISVALIV